MKKIVFYTKEPQYIQSDKAFYFDYVSTGNAIYNFENEIHTTQLCYLSSNLFRMGYDVYILEEDIMYKISDNNYRPGDMYDLLDLYRWGELI